MPTYQIECLECGKVRDERLTYSEYDQVKAGTMELTCNVCHLRAVIGFTPGNLGFVLKEGVSGGWVSKSGKENAYRAKRREEMARRERDHVFKPTLQANYEGIETGSWREAQEMARREKGEASAATYDPLVTQERVTP